MLLGEGEDSVRGRKIIGDDDDRDAGEDRHLEDIPAIANDENGGRNVELLEAFREGGGEHGRDNEHAGLDLGVFFSSDHHAPDRIANVGDGSLDDAAGGEVFERGEKIFSQLESGKQTDTGTGVVHYRQASEFGFAEARHGLVNRRVAVDAHDIALHDILHAGVDIRHKHRRLDPELPEGKIDAGVCVSTAGGDGIFHAGGALEFRIANRGNDRVHVRVAVADNEGFHEMEKWVAGTGL